MNTIGLISIGNQAEEGTQRSDALIKALTQSLSEHNSEVVSADAPAYTPQAALAACEKFKNSGVDIVVLVHATWAQDSLQYIFANKLDVPLILLGVPYVETFSLASVQHFSSVLKKQGINHHCLYGDCGESTLAAEIAEYAKAAKAYAEMKNGNIGLFGPRQTYRVAGAQDMSEEEWSFSKTFGSGIIHIEMDELLEAAKKYEEKELKNTVKMLGFSPEDARIKTGYDSFLKSIAVYLGVKDLFAEYKLTAASAECYPMFGGTCNLAASLLADEGVVLDTEGDIGHAALMHVVNRLGEGKPATLLEIALREDDVLYYAHEGSTAMSLAAKPSDIAINDCGDGMMVGFPLAAMPLATFSTLEGIHGCYSITASTGVVAEAPHALFEQNFSRMLAAVKPDGKAGVFYDNMLKAGVDHHSIIKQGNIIKGLKAFADIAGIDFKNI